MPKKKEKLERKRLSGRPYLYWYKKNKNMAGRKKDKYTLPTQITWYGRRISSKILFFRFDRRNKRLSKVNRISLISPS